MSQELSAALSTSQIGQQKLEMFDRKSSMDIYDQDKEIEKQIRAMYDTRPDRDSEKLDTSGPSFGPSFAYRTASANLRIPRNTLPHDELSSLAKSFKGRSRSRSREPLPPSVTALSGSTCVASPDRPLPDSPSTSDVTSYDPPQRFFSTTDFTPLGHIGKGAHGQVFLVHDKISGEDLAMKVIEKDSLHLSSYPRIFEEQLVGRKLRDCPWALGLEGSFQDQEYFFFLSKYHPGGDLTKLVRRYGKLPISLARQYTAELIVALEEIHSHQVMHRDVKPDNILIDDEGHLVLADFGVSRSFGDPSRSRPWEAYRRWAKTTKEQPSEATPNGSMTATTDCDNTCSPCGTPGFMAPETFGHDGYSYAADIWSAGVVVHYLLMGRLPFGISPAKQTFKELRSRTKVLQLEFCPEERVPGHARTLLRRMLHKEPEKRISIAEMKLHPFFVGIDWDAISQRKTNVESPHLFSYIYHRMNNLPLQEGITIPCSLFTKRCQTPFSWFDYSSPTLLAEKAEAVEPETEAIGSSLRPRRKKSLANKLRGMWKRHQTHAPDEKI